MLVVGTPQEAPKRAAPNNCRHTESDVYESREEGYLTAPCTKFRYLKFRRRRCKDCGHRFRTFEMTEEMITAAEPTTFAYAVELEARMDQFCQEIRDLATRVSREVK
jgi:hypothetical protein